MSQKYGEKGKHAVAKQQLCRVERLAKLFCLRKSRENFQEEQQMRMDDWTAFFAMQSARIVQTVQTTTPVCFL